ncbi:MAG: PrsW family glutamic-type intramembrane protease [Bacteroidota bacterium]
MVLLISSIAPALIIMYLIYKQDLDKEPSQMLVKAFFGGFLAIAITLVIALPLGMFESAVPSGFLRSFYKAFFCAGIPEEFAKWLIFYWLIKKAPHFDQYYDGILYAIFISMGFALVENILYVMPRGIGVAFIRAVVSVPGHMLFVIPMGYYLSLSKFEQGKEAANYRMLSLVIPMLLHGTFDFILMYMGAKASISPLLAGLLVIAFVAFDIYLWRFGLKKIKQHLAKDKSFVFKDSTSTEETLD